MANKKLTINSIMESVPEIKKIDVKLDEECFKDVTIQVKTHLSLEEAMGFVKDVTATCIDSEQAEYLPELFDFAVRMYVLMYYAGIDLTKDVKKAYLILYNTSLFDKVFSCVDQPHGGMLISSADKRIEHWKNILSSSVVGKVTDLMNKMGEVMAGSEAVIGAIDTENFKTAVSKLVDAGVMNNSEQDGTQRQGTLTPDDMRKASELMAGLTPGDAGEDSEKIVYIKKKK